MKGFDFINTIKSEQLNKTDCAVINALVISLFLSYAVTIATLAVVFFMLLINKRMRGLAFNKASAILLALVSTVGGATAIAYKNWLGVLGMFGIAVILTVGQYIASVSTRQVFTETIDLICSLAPVAALTTVGEFIILFIKDAAELRSGIILYLHPNYLGTVAAIIAVLCVYRFFTNNQHRLRYIISGICCLICIVLTGSMFAYIEMTVAAFVMLLCCRKWKSLAIFSICIVIAAGAVYFIPELIPRLEQADSSLSQRISIWEASVELFKQTPLFGQGVLSYMHVQTTVGTVGDIKMFATPHAHSVLLDSLINFGIIGTSLLVIYTVAVWGKSAAAVMKNMKSLDAALIIGILAGVIVHGIVDVTLMWVQPGLIFMIVMGSSSFLRKEKTA